MDIGSSAPQLTTSSTVTVRKWYTVVSVDCSRRRQRHTHLVTMTRTSCSLSEIRASQTMWPVATVPHCQTERTFSGQLEPAIHELLKGRSVSLRDIDI